jgi:hypothetical protein
MDALKLGWLNAWGRITKRFLFESMDLKPRELADDVDRVRSGYSYSATAVWFLAGGAATAVFSAS